MNAITVKELSKYFTLSKRALKRGKGREGMSRGEGMDGGKRKKRKKGKNKMNGGVRAVDNIHFEVNLGEIFGFLGPNGAGKTTTIRMLTGVLKPTKGQIEVFGKPFWKNSITIKQIIGNVPEMANVYADLTGIQNLDFIGELYGISKVIRKRRAEELLKQFELFNKRNFKARKYSKGMKQRLLLCMALMNEPKILFLDEPTSGLDVQSSKIIKQIIKDYHKKGITIFLTTHDMDVANELCDRIAIINKGKIVGLDTPENLKKLFQENQTIGVTFERNVKKEELEKMGSIKEVNKIKDGWVLLVPEINLALIEIIEFAKNNKLEIKELNTLQPSLEDIFLKIIERGVHD
ncbi:MAG: ATP-binding cassette domain-containing protein [Promethearchaeota archaeon]